MQPLVHPLTLATAGYKWGANADVNGARALFCGAQALAMADIGLPEIVEDTFDYENQAGISVGKIFGLRKPKYNSHVTMQQMRTLALSLSIPLSKNKSPLFGGGHLLTRKEKQ